MMENYDDTMPLEYETVEEFLARGGTIRLVPTRRAYSFVEARRPRANNKYARGYRKNDARMGYKISSLYNR